MVYNHRAGVLIPFVQKYYKYLILLVTALFLSSALALTLGASAAKPSTNTNGFDEFGYNRSARVFSGTFGGWCAEKGYLWDCSDYAGGAYTSYANDHLVMKWNKAWDDCNAALNDDEAVCKNAWLNNEWNGMIPGGSGETEHFKAIWITPTSCGPDGTPLDDGGYCIWGHYEAILDFYGPGQPDWQAHAIPNGYDVKP